MLPASIYVVSIETDVSAATENIMTDKIHTEHLTTRQNCVQSMALKLVNTKHCTTLETETRNFQTNNVSETTNKIL